MNPPSFFLRRLVWFSLLAAAAGTDAARGQNVYNFLPTAPTVVDGHIYDWNTAANWDVGVGFPNAVGDIARRSSGIDPLEFTVSTNLSTPIVLGTVGLSGNTSSFTITQSASTGLTLNQDGAGPGSAAITNEGTTTGRIYFNGGTITLADDLRITNASAATGNSILFNSAIGGLGNITIRNTSNNPAAGQIVFQATSTAPNTFTGSVTIESGAVTFNNRAAFSDLATNTIFLGSFGGGSASLIGTAATGTGAVNAIDNHIVVAGGSGGTLLLGSTSTTVTGSNFSGTILLNGDLTLTSANTGAGGVYYSGAISGPGGLFVTGTGNTRLMGVNTYTGDTTVDAGTLFLQKSAEMTFVLQNGNVSNRLHGSGGVNLDGVLRLNINGVTQESGVWNLVDVGTLSETFGVNFKLAFVGGGSFTSQGGGIYSSGNWTFTASDGNLTLAAVPEPGMAVFFGLGALVVLGALRHRPAAR